MSTRCHDIWCLLGLKCVAAESGSGADVRQMWIPNMDVGGRDGFLRVSNNLRAIKHVVWHGGVDTR